MNYSEFGDKREVRIADYVALGNYDDVKKLIDARYDVNEKDEEGNTPAIIAASRNDFKMLKMLVDAGAKLNVTNDNGDSPLQFSQQFKNTEMENFINSVITTQFQRHSPKKN